MNARRHKTARKAAVTIFSCSMVLSNMQVMPIMASMKANISQRAQDVFTDFENVSADQYTKNAPGNFTIKNNGNNNRLISDIRAKSFTYEAKFKLNTGDRGSLVFGSTRKTQNDTGSFFGLELSAKDGGLYVKMFQDNGYGGELINSTLALAEYDKTQAIPVKLSIDENDNLELYVNDKKVELKINNKFKEVYAGGYLGLLTWNSEVTFSDIKVTRNSDATPSFKTNLTNLKSLRGEWKDYDEGMLHAGGGDNFAMSETVGTDFVYSADIKVPENGAAALVFRSNDDGSKSYVANISRNEKRARIFRFPGGVDMGSTAIENTSKDTYKLRVEAMGSSIRYYVDDQLITAANDTTYASGKLGLLTFNGAVTYQNLEQKVLDAATYPRLKGLEIIGEGAILTPEFNQDAAAYDLFVPRSAAQLKLKTSADADKLTYRITTAGGTELVPETTIQSGVESGVLALPSGASKITIKAVKGDISTTTLINVNKMFSKDEMVNEQYRPQYHFSPETNFMNDPNGLVYDPSNQTWHMFFQKQPGVGWVNGQMWGHAQSKDLVNWEELPIAMHVDDLGLIFSGSAVVDEDNTSGFFTDNKEGESKLVAIFTHAGHGTQVQSIAYSKDHGLTWTKYSGNPVIPNPGGKPYSGDFRDPKVWRYDNKWYMVAAGGRGRLFASEDLKTWTHVEDFFFANGSELHSECPDFFPLKVDGTGKTKWVYSGGGEFYVIGDFVKQSDGYYHFVAETNRIDAPNGKTLMYATQSYYNDPSGKDRKMLISWLQDYSAPDSIPEKGWNGVQSIPLEVGLKTVNGKEIVTHYPAEEIDLLHGDVLFETKDKTISNTSENLLRNVTGRIYDVQADFTLGTAKEFGFNLRTGNGQKIVFKYNKETKKMILDKSHSGAAYNNVIDWELLPSKDNKVSLRILVDEGVVDAFGNKGEANISDLCFPSNQSVGMEFFATDGDVRVDNMKIYDMKSMYSGKSLADSGIESVLSLATPGKVETGDTFSVSANLYPAMKDTIEWTYNEGLTKLSEKDGTITFRADKNGTYNVTAKAVNSKKEKTVEIKVITPIFDTNLIDFKATAGTWEKAENGLHGANGGLGDVFNMSGTKVGKDTAFTYEGDIHFASGTAVGMTFGVQDKNNPGRSWMCMNVEKGDKNVAKLFKNTGNEDWSVDHKLSDSEKNAKDYHFKLEYDGSGKLTYYLNNVLVATKENSGFNGGYVGLNTFHGDATFNNVTFTTKAKVTSIVTPMKDIELEKGSVEKDLTKLLPKEVTVEKEDGVQVAMPITWDIKDVDFNKAGTYSITGSLAGSDVSATVNVKITEVVLTSTNPASISISAKEGTSADKVFQEINKKVTGTYSDGSKKDMTITGWDASKVDVTKVGTYKTVGYLDNSKDMTIPINVTITKADAPVEQTTLTNKDKSIQVSGLLPTDVTLKTEVLKASDVAKTLKDKTYLKTHALEYVVDFTLWQNGERYTPTSKLTIQIDRKAEWKDKKLSVIYIDDKGNLKEVEAIVKGDKILFNTDHLSIFAIVSEKGKTPVDPDKPVKPEKPNTPDNGDNKPGQDKPSGDDVKTGDISQTTMFTVLLGTAVLGMFAIRRKKEKNKETI